jgi:fatty-acyl-CoA synthase
MTEAPPKTSSPAQAWVRALERTANLARNPERILSTVIEELAERSGDAPALLSERECLTYRALTERANRYSRWAIAQGIAKGECVGLFMPNRPEYLAIWLGITQVGGVVSLLNTNLTGASLAHCINIVAPKHLIVAASLMGSMATALSDLTTPATVWIDGPSEGPLPRLDRDV